MQFRIYDRQTLAYKDGGYVASYIIDDDYIVNNNSTINIIKELNNKVVVGDTIVLIKTSGAYHKGTITTFDNADYTITYKADRELFNDNIINIYRQFFAEEENKESKYARKLGISDIAMIIDLYFGKANDWLRKLPIKVITEGEVVDKYGNNRILWSWKNDTINFVDWLIELFEKYNIRLSWDIDFNISEKVLSQRNPYYIVTLSATTNAGKIIKDNIDMQTITYTEKKLPEATVCAIIDSSTKETIMLNSGKNLLNPNLGETNTYISFNKETGTTSKTEDKTSNISGFIEVEPKEFYTLSVGNNDNKVRYILFYDKDKNLRKCWTYTLSPTVIENTNLFITQTNPETQEEERKEIEIKYLQVCYYNNGTSIQLEKGKVATEYDNYNTEAIYYLYDYKGEYYVSLKQDESIIETENGKMIKKPLRVMPSKFTSATFNTNELTGNDLITAVKEVAENTLIPSKFNQAVEIQINSNSKMFDFDNANFGDMYKIINQYGTIESNYTGRKEESQSKYITLYFGLGRQKYTDLMQLRMRKNKYEVVYNSKNKQVEYGI